MKALLLSVLIAIGLSAQIMPSHRRAVGRQELGAAPPAECLTTDTALSHNELLEGWQGASDENTWTLVNGSSGVTINTNYDSTAFSSGKPAGACNEAMEVVVEASATTPHYVRWNHGSLIDIDTTPTDLIFYLWVSVKPDTTGETFYIAELRSTTTAGLATAVSMRNSTGALQISALGASQTAWSVITMNTWHKIKVHAAGGTDGCSFTIDDGTPATFTRNSTYDVQYVVLGTTGALTIGDTGTFYVDLVCLDTP